MSGTSLNEYWPVISSVLGVMFGGAVTWGITKSQLVTLFKNYESLVLRVSALEAAQSADRVALADRLARIEAKLDFYLSQKQ